MDSIKIDIAGDRQAGLRFDEFPDVLYEDLRKEIEELSLELLLRVEAATPSRTGLLRSEERLRLFTDKDRITGYIDVKADGQQEHIKAGALEYGAHKKHKVSSHTMRLDHFWEQKLDAPITVLVDAIPDRTANITEIAFLRGPLEAMRPEIAARLRAVVENAVTKANE